MGEDLKELGMSAASLARSLAVPTNRVTEIINGQRSITGRYRFAPGPFLRHKRGILAEFAEYLRSAEGAREDREFAEEASTFEPA